MLSPHRSTVWVSLIEAERLVEACRGPPAAPFSHGIPQREKRNARIRIGYDLAVSEPHFPCPFLVRTRAFSLSS